MDFRDARPPRGAPPPHGAASPPRYDSRERERPLLNPTPGQRGNVSFQINERGDRQAPLDDNRQRHFSAYRDAALPPTPNDNGDMEAGEGFDQAHVARKKSLVRPDREKIEPGHRQWHYRTHAAQLEDEGRARVGLLPSSASFHALCEFTEHSTCSSYREPSWAGTTIAAGKSLLGREQDVPESGLALFKRGATLRRRQSRQTIASEPDAPRKSRCLPDVPGPHDAWMTYCYFLTFCIPSFLLRSCGASSLFHMFF